MTDAPEGLSAPERCDNCNGWIETAVGMDSYVTINDYDATEHDHYVFCDWSCVSEWFEDVMAGQTPK